MPEPKKPKQDKKLSLHPLEFEEALKGLLANAPTKRGTGEEEQASNETT